MSIDTKILNRLNSLDEESKLRVLNFADTIIKENGIKPVKDILEIEEIKNVMIQFCEKYPMNRIGLFGSYARGEADEESDIDLVVEFAENIGLMKILGLKVDLEEHFRKKVDLVEMDNLYEYVKKDIIKDIVTLYEWE